MNMGINKMDLYFMEAKSFTNYYLKSKRINNYLEEINKGTNG